MDKLVNFLMVGLGGAAGSMLRYGMTLLCSALSLSGNVATFGVNILVDEKYLAEDGKKLK